MEESSGGSLKHAKQQLDVPKVRTEGKIKQFGRNDQMVIGLLGEK